MLHLIFFSCHEPETSLDWAITGCDWLRLVDAIVELLELVYRASVKGGGEIFGVWYFQPDSPDPSSMGASSSTPPPGMSLAPTGLTPLLSRKEPRSRFSLIVVSGRDGEIIELIVPIMVVARSMWLSSCEFYCMHCVTLCHHASVSYRSRPISLLVNIMPQL